MIKMVEIKYQPENLEDHPNLIPPWVILNALEACANPATTEVIIFTGDPLNGRFRVGLKVKSGLNTSISESPTREYPFE